MRRPSPRRMHKPRGLSGRGDRTARQGTRPAAPGEPAERGVQRAHARDPITTPRRVAGGAQPVDESSARHGAMLASSLPWFGTTRGRLTVDTSGGTAKFRIGNGELTVQKMSDGTHRVSYSGTERAYIRPKDLRAPPRSLASTGEGVKDGDSIQIGTGLLTWHNPRTPSIASSKLPIARTLPRMGIIFGGIRNIGYGREIPHECSVVSVNKNLDARFNVNEDRYEVKESGKPWRPLIPGQTIIVGDSSYSIGEFGGKNSLTSGTKLLEQIRDQLATEGKRQRLIELADRGVKITEVDGKNIDVFRDESFDRAIIAYDSGHPGHTQGGLLGGTSTAYALVDPVTGRIHGFCTDAPAVKSRLAAPRFNVVRQAGGRYTWVERSGLAQPKPVDMGVAPQGSVIVSFTFERMTGRLFVDPELRQRGLRPEAIQHIARLEGLVVRMGTAAGAAWMHYLDMTKLPAKDSR